MKLTEAWIQNALGLYINMNVKEIHIDFTKHDSKFVIISGESGSGKSTLASLFSMRAYPVRAQGDMKLTKGFNIPGTRMIKQLTYAGSHQVRSIYNDSSSAHYFREWVESENRFVERNSNGTLSGYRRCMFDYLGIMPEHFKLLELSTEVLSFVDDTAVIRKKTMNKLMGGNEEYDDIYDLATDRAKRLRAEIKRLSSNAAQIGDIKQLENKKMDAEKEINIIEGAIATANKLLGEVELGLNTMPSSVKNINIGELESEQTANTNMINNISAEYTIPNAESLDREVLQRELTEANIYMQDAERSEMKVRVNIDSIRHLISTQHEKINSLNKELTSNSIIDIDVIMNRIKNARNTVQLCENNIDRTIYSNNINIKEEMDDLISKLNHWKTTRAYIPDMRTVMSYSDPCIEDVKQSKVSDIANRNVQLNDINTTIREYYSAIKSLDGADIDAFEIKEGCTTCVLYTTFKSVISSKDEIHVLEQKATELTKLNEDDQYTVDDSLSPLIITKNVYINIMVNYGCTLHNYEEYVNHHLPDIDVWDSEVSKYKTYCRLIEAENEIRDLEISIDSDSKISIINDKIQSISESIRDNDSKVIRLEPAHEEAKSHKSVAAYSLSRVSESIRIINLLERNIVIHDKINSVTDIRDIKLKIEKLNSNIAECTQRKKAKESILSSVGYKIRELNDANINLGRLKEEMKGVLSVKTACCSVQGIPAMRINSYLDRNNMLTKVNGFLAEFFDDSLRVIDFDINKTSFDIIVDGGTNPYARDVSLCSKSERRSCALAITLALQDRIFKGSLKYNIPILDEMDDGLDEYKKQMFIQVLSRYFKYDRRKTTNIEQVILPTHNNKLYDVDASIIMLRGSSIEVTPEIEEKIIYRVIE